MSENSLQPKYTINCREYLCPFQLTISVFNGKWKLKIVKALCDKGKLRYSELKKSLYEEITHKMLIQSLRQLEGDGIVNRIVYPQVPPKVEYELTEDGHRLSLVIEAMNAFGKKYIKPVG